MARSHTAFNVLFVLLSVFDESTTASKQTRPNIIFMFGDDLVCVPRAHLRSHPNPDPTNATGLQRTGLFFVHRHQDAVDRQSGPKRRAHPSAQLRLEDLQSIAVRLYLGAISLLSRSPEPRVQRPISRVVDSSGFHPLGGVFSRGLQHTHDRV